MSLNLLSTASSKPTMSAGGFDASRRRLARSASQRQAHPVLDTEVSAKRDCKELLICPRMSILCGSENSEFGDISDCDWMVAVG